MRAALLLVFALPACGHDHDHDHDEGVRAYEDGMTAQTSGGHFEVSLTLSGGGQVGTHDVVLVLDHHGTATGAEAVALDAYMPGHGHGTDPVEVVEGDELGVYVAEGLSLFMPGVWALTVTVDEPGHGGEAVFAVEIEE